MFASVFSKKSSAPSRRPRSFVPSLESLEAREVLDATASFSEVSGVGTVLFITGTNAGETVEIFNNGNGNINANGVIGLNPPGQSPTAQTVERIVINMRLGDDTVRFFQGAPGAGVTQTRGLEVFADLGFGGDTFRAELHGTLADDLLLDVNGSDDSGLDTGIDTILVNAGRLDSGPTVSFDRTFTNPTGTDNANDFDVLSGAELKLRLSAGAGDDFIRVQYQGELDGRLLLDAAGLNGNDDVYAILDLDAGSSGQVTGENGNPARVGGGLGDDDLVFVVDKDNDGDAATVFGEIGGSLGYDEAVYNDQFVDVYSIANKQAL